MSLCFYDFFIKQLSDSVPVKKDKLHMTGTLFNQYSSAHDDNRSPELPSPQISTIYLARGRKGRKRHILLSPR